MADKKFIFMNTDGFHEEAASNSTLALGGLTMSGAIAMGNNKITGLASGTASGDAITYDQLQSAIVGLYWSDPAVVVKMISDADQGGSAPSSPTIGDAYVVNNWGVEFTDGDIIEYSGVSGSLWVVVQADTAGEPADGTRVVVAASGLGGSFAGHGDAVATYNATLNSWSFQTPDDGDALLCVGDLSMYADMGFTYNGSAWIQFTGTGLITAGDGLVKTGNTLSVDLATDPGLEFDASVPGNLKAKVNTAAGLSIASTGIAIDLATAGAGTGGLEFDISGDVQVKVDGSHGIVLGSSGLEIEIDDSPDTLDVSGSGLKVVGVPSLFKINGTSVGASVTAGNLDDLVDGSDATALHFHTKVKLPFTASGAIAKADPVYKDATNDVIAKADASVDAKRWVFGIAEAAILDTEVGNVILSGAVLTGALSGATAGTRYWLAAGGGLTTTRPTGANSTILIGYAKNATDLIVDIRDYGKGV